MNRQANSEFTKVFVSPMQVSRYIFANFLQMNFFDGLEQHFSLPGSAAACSLQQRWPLKGPGRCTWASCARGEPAPGPVVSTAVAVFEI